MIYGKGTDFIGIMVQRDQCLIVRQNSDALRIIPADLGRFLNGNQTILTYGKADHLVGSVQRYIQILTIRCKLKRRTGCQ